MDALQQKIAYAPKIVKQFIMPQSIRAVAAVGKYSYAHIIGFETLVVQ
jgi:hypothetical protein